LVADVHVIVVKPVLVLTACACKDFEVSGMDDISQLTPSCLRGGVIIWSMQIAQIKTSKPHLEDDEAVIPPIIGIADRLCYQHVLSISPSDENNVQQLPAPRPRVHPHSLPPRRKAEEGVGQQETVFRKGAVLALGRVQAIEDNAGEDLSSDFQQRDTCVVVAELAVLLLLVEVDNSGMLVNLSKDRIRARCFPTGELLHGFDGFLERGREIKVGVDFHFKQSIDGTQTGSSAKGRLFKTATTLSL
uniref:Pept_C1 domain-containing protein n=1 Tax=Schistocephalus solidus TaxID=70667 RepID=A0A183T9M3_SCHSO